MSRFRDDFALAFEDVLFERGDTIKVHPLNQRVQCITAIVDEKTTRDGRGSSHETEITCLEVQCLKSAIPHPQAGDFVEWNNEVYDFDQQLGDEGGVYRIRYLKTDVTQAGIKKPDQL